MSEQARWEERYRTGDTPWDTGERSSELVRVVAEEKVAPCRAIELGSGTGTNAVWLARQGFDVTAVDLSELALERARRRAAAAGVAIRFLLADVLALPELGEPFPFFFDRGCYHVVRRIDVQAFLRTLERITTAGSLGLVLTGNAREKHEPGPPVVTAEEIRAELGSLFEIVRLREFRFDQVEADGMRYLGWSCLLRR
jgi:2-polyprenyl-3-methyl-5-hydroxy-6-metoxy-1,4-benzoquinol methylase